jgi:hypothetical protein
VDFLGMNVAYVHDPFPTPFSDEVLDQVVEKEAYSFTNDFFGYHQVCTAEEDDKKTTFAIEWGSYAYNVMPFRLKNALAIFSWIMITTFKEYIHKFMEVYLDQTWMIGQCTGC